MMKQAYVVAVLTGFHGLVGFAGLNLVAWACLETFPADPITLTYGKRPFALVYPGRSAEEVRALLHETWSRPVAWEPFTESRERSFRGRFVNVHPAGFRLSRGQGPWPPDPKRTNVFVFGGSTTFGYGVADDETIVSGLQDFCDERLGRGRVAFYNFGRASYYSSVERILFQELLAADTVPDVAVFIDGLNEFVFGAPFPASRLRLAVNKPVVGLLARVTSELPLVRLVSRWKADRPKRRDASALLAYDDPGLLDARIARYLANRRLISAAAADFDVRPLFVWQPVPTYRYDLRDHLFGDLDFQKNNYSTFGYGRMAKRRSREGHEPDFLWLADLQEGLHLPLYVDQIHYSAAMSRLVAAEIGEDLLEKGLLSSAPPSRPPARHLTGVRPTG